MMRGGDKRELVYAPWSDEVVEKLRKHQGDKTVHPYTCGCGKPLTPTREGWACHHCYSHIQPWCLVYHIEGEEK